MNRHKVVRFVVKCFGAYMLFNIVDIVKKEVVLEKARIIKEQQVRYGGDFELSEEKREILEQAEQYMDNHMGYRYLNRARTQQFFQQQLTKLLEKKQQALKQTDKDQEQAQKLKSQIDQLKKAYQSVHPKMPTSWQDLRQKQ